MAEIAADHQHEWEPAAIPTETFGQRLRLIRFMLDESVDGIADLCGVAAPTWRTWERGATPRKLVEIVQKVVTATHDRFAPDAPVAAMRDWLIWGPDLRNSRIGWLLPLAA